MIPSYYFLYARLAPAIICAVPFFVLYFFFLAPLLGPFFESLIRVQWIGDVSTLTAFVLLLVLVGRSIAKDIFERYWFRSDETRMPTTDFLLHSEREYTDGFKAKVHEKIKHDFGIAVLPAEVEDGDEDKARRVIAEAVGQIRQKVKDGRLVLQHNMEYGFFRNLIGCSVIAVVISVLDALIFYSITPNIIALRLSLIMIIGYLLPIILAKTFMRTHGKRYARVLIQEFMAQ